MNELKWIRFVYGVEAHRGHKVEYLGGNTGTILGGKQGWLRVRSDRLKRTILLHPTYQVKYLLTIDAAKGGAE
jgi:hypothetical protein